MLENTLSISYILGQRNIKQLALQQATDIATTKDASSTKHPKWLLLTYSDLRQLTSLSYRITVCPGTYSVQ